MFGDRFFFLIYSLIFLYNQKVYFIPNIVVFSVELKDVVYAFVFDQENQFCSTTFSAGCKFHCLYLHWKVTFFGRFLLSSALSFYYSSVSSSVRDCFFGIYPLVITVLA